MTIEEYQASLNAALEKALASTNGSVRSAYFELGLFYYHKICDAADASAAATLLQKLAPECCQESQCCFKKREVAA